MLESIGALELTSVGLGYAAQDAMLKAADVRLLLGRTICSGKYIIVVTGAVAATTEAVDAGVAGVPEGIIDHGVVAQIHPSVFKALGQSVELTVSASKVDSPATPKALGVIETFSGVSVLQAADVAAKSANVELFRIHLAMALGGKGFALMAGSVADIRAAVDAGAQVVRDKGLLVSSVVIPGPSRELFAEYI